MGLGVAALLFWPIGADSQPYAEEVDATAYRALAQLTARVSAAELQAARALVDPYGQLEPYLDIRNDVAVVRIERDGPVVAKIQLRDTSKPRPALRVRHVLIDPGHRGGTWSRTEARHFELDANGAVREGDLTYATARLLQEQLEAVGVPTALTRGAPPERAFLAEAFPGFDAAREARWWLAESRFGLGLPPWWVRRPSLVAAWLLARERDRFVEESLFELYNRFELRQRALQAAALEQPITISLHYNVSPRQENGIVVFVPGNFLLGELVTASQRYYALRRLLDGSLAPSIELGRQIGLAMQLHLGLGVLGEVDEQSDLELDARRLIVDPEAGVFARNLAMLRRTPGVVVLVEGPCMNAPLEHTELQRQQIRVDGRGYPERTLAYARAVASALLQLPR